LVFFPSLLVGRVVVLLKEKGFFRMMSKKKVSIELNLFKAFLPIGFRYYPFQHCLAKIGFNLLVQGMNNGIFYSALAFCQGVKLSCQIILSML
jgi:hypothetical protein